MALWGHNKADFSLSTTTSQIAYIDALKSSLEQGTEQQNRTEQTAIQSFIQSSTIRRAPSNNWIAIDRGITILAPVDTYLIIIGSIGPVSQVFFALISPLSLTKLCTPSLSSLYLLTLADSPHILVLLIRFRL